MLALLVADWGAALLGRVRDRDPGRRPAVRGDRGRRRTPPRGPPRLVGMIATLGLSQLILVMSLLINSDGVSGFTFPQADRPADLQDPVAADRHAVRRDAGARARSCSPASAGSCATTGWASRSGPRPTTPTPPARGHPGSLDGHAGLGDRRWHRRLLRDPGDPDDGRRRHGGPRPRPAAQGPRRCGHRPDVVDPDRDRRPRSASA